MAFGDVLKAAAGIYLAVGIGGYAVQQWKHTCSVGDYPAAIGPSATVKSTYDRLRESMRGEKSDSIFMHGYSAVVYPVRFWQQVANGDSSVRDFVLARQCKPAQGKKLTERR